MSRFFQNLEKPFNLLDEQAFAANRRGEITAAQRKQFSSDIGGMKIILLVFLMLVFSTIFVFAIFMVVLGGKYIVNIFLAIFIGGIFLLLLLAAGYRVWVQLNRYLKFRRDDTNRAIHQGQGQLLYGKKGYTFDMAGSSLQMPANQSCGLLPGVTYQVYSLEESGFLLSAAVARPSTPAQTITAINDILASANGFTADDVLKNQQGEVSFAQRRKLFLNAGLGIAIILIMLVPIVVFLFFTLSTTRSIQGASFFGILMLLGLMLLVGIVILWRSLLELFAPKLGSAQGLVFKKRRVVHTGKGSYIEYSYTINNQQFNINYRAYTALIDGLEYRIYYLARTKKLVSIEVLSVSTGTNQPF